MWVCFSGWRCMCKLGLIMSKSSWKWREERLTLSGEMLFHSIPSIPLCISSLSTSMILHCGPLLSSSPLLRTLLFLIDWSKIFRLFYLYYLSFLHLHLCLLCHSCRCILLCFEGSKTESLGEIHLVSQKLMSRGVNNTVMARQACWKQSMRKQPKVSHWANLNLVRGFWSLPLSCKRLMV